MCVAGTFSEVAIESMYVRGFGPCLPLKALTLMQAHISIRYEFTIQYMLHSY